MSPFSFCIVSTTGADVRAVVSQKKIAQKKRAFNPKGLQFVTIPEPDEEESADVFWERLQDNWKILASNCVSLSSRVTYQTAWKHWETFCGRIKAPVSLAVVFPGWRPQTSIHPYEVTMIVSFIAYLQSRTSPKLKPGTVDNYVSGLRHCLTQCGLDEKVFKVQVIRQCRAALNIQHRIENPENEENTLPFLAEWFPVLRRLVSLVDVKSFMLVVACQLAFVCLMRYSEVILTADDHFLRACDVKFCMINVDDGSEFWVLPEHAYLYSSDFLKGKSLRVRSAKNDQGGRGYKYYFERDSALSSTAAFDLVLDMFKLAQVTRPQGEEAFFSMRDRSGTYRLPYYRMNEIVKTVATEMGMDPVRYSSHSFRIGGATVLAAANFPDYVIQNMGRWKSLAFLHYLHWAPSMMRAAMKVLTDTSVFTMRDLQNMNAGV